MHVTGIVAEYNPFHTGHRYHIEKAKAETETDALVAVMSGSFVQRGEPAIFDKWTRTEHALLGGVDLVLELPTVYAISSAEGFAYGAIETLRATGVVSCLSFGSECGDAKLLKRAADVLQNETPAFRSAMHRALASGKTYPMAKTEAVKKTHPELSRVLCTPNNLLGATYLRYWSGEIHTTCRIGAGHLETEEKDGFLSATEIRRRLFAGEDIRRFLPYACDGLLPHSLADYASLILYALRTAELTAYPTIPTAVCQRLRACNCESLEAVLESAKTRHIVLASLRRALLQILLQNKILPKAPPSYIRVLGFTERGAAVLKKMKKTAQLPLICRPAAFKDPCPIWELEKRATDIYFMPVHKTAQDVKRAPIRI